MSREQFRARVRIYGALLVAVGCVALVSSTAHASAGSHSDANDSNGIDIQLVTHDDDAQNAKYGIDTYEPINPSSDIFVTWGYDLTGDAQVDACAFFGTNGAGSFEAFFLADCSDQNAQPMSVPWSRPADDRAEIQVPLQALRDAGLGSRTQLGYAVLAFQFTTSEFYVDAVPEEPNPTIVHALGAPSPTPTATASPTANPSASPSSSPAATATPTPTPAPNVSIEKDASKAKASPGEKVNIEGDGFAAGANLTLTFNSTPVSLGTMSASTAGSFATTITIPVGADPGPHHIVVAGADQGGGTRTISYPITVIASDAVEFVAAPASATSGTAGLAATTAPQLPATGRSLTTYVILACLLTVTGVELLIVRKVMR